MNILKRLEKNAGGPKGVKYGITKHYVKGLEAVLADGSVTRTGALSDNPAEPDLTGLFLASEGAFGLVTSALLKITPLPQNYRTVLAVFDDLGKSGRAVSRIIAAGIIPTALEIMDHELIVALEDYLHLGFPLEAQALGVPVLTSDAFALSETVVAPQTKIGGKQYSHSFCRR